jgi:uncharacterized protein with HEPN domain
LEKDYNAYANHILDSIILIEKYTEDISFEEFEKDSKTIDAVIRNFEIIGEASSKLPKEFRERYPDVPWKSIIDVFVKSPICPLFVIPAKAGIQ